MRTRSTNYVVGSVLASLIVAVSHPALGAPTQEQPAPLALE
jgi:hypothetical protein